MMPALLAEESMRAAERIAVGTGALDSRASRKVIERWHQDAAVERPRGQRATPETLAAIGIGYHVVKGA